MKSKIGHKLRSGTMRLIISALLITVLPLIGLFCVNYFKNIISQMNTIHGQIIQQLNLKTSNIIAYANQIPTDKLLLSLLDEEKTPQNHARIENRLMELCGIGSGIENIILSCEQGNFHSVFINDEQMEEILFSPWFLSLKQQEYSRYFSAPDAEENVFHYSMHLDNISSLSGELIITIRADDLMQIMNSSNKTFSHYLWLDNKNSKILDHAFEEEEYLYSLLSGPEKAQFFDTHTFYSSKGVFLSSHSDVTRWKFVAFLPYTELLLPFLPTFFILLISVFLSTGISGIILNPLIRNIVSPLEILSEHMRDFSYDKVLPVSIHTGDEIEDLSHTFNNMAFELKKHINLLLEEQKKEQELKYALRISQINPHFIYNTMNTITYLARKNRSSDIVIINNALIHIMKDSLRINENSIFDTIDTELKVVTQYLKIQEYRYEKSIHIIWDIQDSVRSVKIPKHIIQPLVENAIVHGFLEDNFESLESEEPSIYIRSFSVKNGICIQIEDNGRGIDMDNYQKICTESEHFDASGEYNRGKHIGLANIKWRLAYLLNEKQELSITPCSPHGTLVTLKIFQADTH